MIVYRDYTQEALDRQYEHKHFVPDHAHFAALAKEENQRVRAAAKGRFDIAYGDGSEQRLDIYMTAAGGPSPVVVFFHGGRWRHGSKTSACHGADSFTDAGVHFVSVNYDLLPTVTMDGLVDQCRKAVAWIHRHAESFGGDPDRIYIMGKSAGALIGGMMVTTDWAQRGLPADLLKGGLLISGMYDLEPVRLTFRNEWLKLDPESAARNSPIRHIPARACPLVLGCGSLETDEFRRHTREFAAAWRAHGHDCDYGEVPDKHHYSIYLYLKQSPLFAKMAALMGLTAPIL